ncbi:MAG TPA: DUF2905 domain-containing protein [Candidatus Saccharimonadales bacterium]|nr:DUF2905 domain-containing protein [Candidatus Saccharimonadales bacterium]
MGSLPRILVVVGLALVALGLLLYALPSVPFLGRLPGDIRIERPGFRLYVPITSCIVASLILTFILWLISRLR